MIWPTRRKNRYQYYNYNHDGLYFITICTHKKQSFFGDIQNGFMCLSPAGSIAYEHWVKINNVYPFIFLDRFVIMPDHIHALIGIKKYGSSPPKTGTDKTCSLPKKHRRQFELLPKIIGQYKRSVSKKIRQHDPFLDFQWQKSFHDHIVRNGYQRFYIQKYILNNPKNWDISV